MKEPVDHIIRPPLPWRLDPGITECGYDATKVSSISREAYRARLKELGVARSYMLTCMTCAQTATRWEPWEIDPRKAIGREIDWESRWRRDQSDAPDRLRYELLAMADLIAARREEFDAAFEAHKRRHEWLAMKDQRRKNP